MSVSATVATSILPAVVVLDALTTASTLPVVTVPTVVRLAAVVILACVACVVAVSGASPVIVVTVAAFPVIEPAIALVTCKSVYRPLVILVKVEPISHVSWRLDPSYVSDVAHSIVPSHVHTHI